MSEAPGGCFINLRFAPAEENISEKVMNAISGEVTLKSDMPELDVAKVEVQEINLGYAYPEELQSEDE